MIKILKGISILTLAISLQSCGETALPDPNPGIFDGVDITININQSPYTTLQNVGGSALISAQKIMVARLSSSDWAAVSSTCPNDASLTMRFNQSNATFSCGNATFDYTGKATSGSTTNLKKYYSSFSNNNGNLRIFE